jgi:hypothetical protein
VKERRRGKQKPTKHPKGQLFVLDRTKDEYLVMLCFVKKERKKNQRRGNLESRTEEKPEKETKSAVDARRLVERNNATPTGVPTHR